MGSDDVESTFVPDPDAQQGDHGASLSWHSLTHTSQTMKRKKRSYSDLLPFGETGLASKGASFTATRIQRTSGCSQRSTRGMIHAFRAAYTQMVS